MWVKGLIYRALRDWFGAPDLAFQWLTAEDEDSLAQAQTTQIYLQSGVRTVNEVRAGQGLAPIAGGDVALILAGNALVPLANAGQVTTPSPAGAVAKYSADQPRVPAGNTGGGEWTSAGGGGGAVTVTGGLDRAGHIGARTIQVADSGAIMSDAPSTEMAASDYYSGDDIDYLARALGMDRDALGEAIHEIKAAAGLSGSDRLTFHLRTGDAYFRGEIVGNVRDK